ncbi:UNVERIFIED_CONTAM: NADPH-dependent aldehyde reductase-like protein, chloroplastic [Sesamum radiatum]|uniref:NADPH-dependent aldehyde reductase-like protein, chloroplastic n=1 Tax=Sesamum radiatum TaxID=300843 RepID=A0AAW2NR45_SESRA
MLDGVTGGGIDSEIRGVHSVKGGGGGNGEDTSEGAEGNGDHCECGGTRGGGDGYVLRGKTEETVKKLVEECPMGRLGEVDDVAPVVGFLASDAGEWVNGQIIRVDGGCV